MGFSYFNPNPAGQKVGDCTVRAIAKATGKSWDEVYIGLCLQGLIMGDLPSANSVWGAYLRQHGFTRNVIPNTCRIATRSRISAQTIRAACMFLLCPVMWSVRRTEAISTHGTAAMRSRCSTGQRRINDVRTTAVCVQQPIYNQPIGQPISQPMQEPMMRPQYQPAPQMPAYQPAAPAAAESVDYLDPERTGRKRLYRRAQQCRYALGYERAGRVCEKGRCKRQADHDDLRPCRACAGRASARSAAKRHERGICDPQGV